MIVVARWLRGAAGERTNAVTGWQHVWVLYLVDYALIWTHPFHLVTADWYDAVTRPLGLVAMLAGIVVVLWAYATMGGYWSGDVSVRRDHVVVDTGPFAFVRHPVYAAYLLGVFGAALALADPAVAVAAVISVPVMRGRAMAEERFLEAHLGDAYRDYRRRVRMFPPKLF